METAINKNGKKVNVYIPKKDSDDLNEKFLFSGIYTDLLVAIVNGQIDTKKLAFQELRNRGLNSDGIWIGFETK